MRNEEEATVLTYDECYIDLRTCREQFESIQADVDDLVANRSERQILWRPQGDAWSIAECLAHLVDLAERSLERVREAHALALAVEIRTRGPVRHRRKLPLLAPLSVPAQRPLSHVMRPEVANGDEVVDAFRRVNRRTLRLIEQVASGGGGRPPRAIALIAGIGHGLQLAALQHWRFILEARRVTERPGFPHR